MPISGSFAELAALRRQLDRIGREGIKRVSKQVALEARQLVAEGFQRSQSPSGQAWAPVKRGGSPLRDTGRLANSFAIVDTGAGFSVATNVAYAGVHQHGATIRAKGKKSLYSPRLRQFFGRQVVIPARPFLPEADLPAAWDARLTEAAEEALEAFFG